MTLFVAWPLLSAPRYAFFSFKGVAPDAFVGLRNFADGLIEEPFASWTWRALRHNVIAFAALMVFQNGLAYLIVFSPAEGLPGHRAHQVMVAASAKGSGAAGPSGSRAEPWPCFFRIQPFVGAGCPGYTG